MPGQLDAEDAAQHALIEVLRTAHQYRSDVSVERFCDGLAGRSIARFARAVRRRKSGPEKADDGVGDELSEHDARSTLSGLSAQLARLSHVRREALVLRHVLGFSVDEIGDLTRAQPSMVRERLLAARRDMRTLASEALGTSRRPGGGDMETANQRWAELRDREALGHKLTVEESEECAAIETAEPFAQVAAAQQRDLEHMLDRASLSRPTPYDRDLVDQVMRAVRVTSTAHPRTQREEPDQDLERVIDPDGPGWIRNVSIGFTVLLSVAAAVALALYEPKHSEVDAIGPTFEPQVASAPSVVSLVHARTLSRGGRVTRFGKTLAPDTVLRERDVLEAGVSPACFLIEPAVDVCMSAHAQVRLESLSRDTRAVEVLSGRVTVRRAEHGSSAADGIPFALVAGPLSALASGSVFGLERMTSGEVRIRVVEGHVLSRVATWSTKISAGQMGVLRADGDTLVMEALPPGQIAREWELISTGMRPAPDAARPLPEALGEPPTTAAAPEPSDPKTPEQLLREGWDQVKAKRYPEAIATYERIRSAHPQSQEAHVVLVRLGDLVLEHLGAAERALSLYDGYLREGGGPLEREARYGRIEALRELGKGPLERAAIEEYLALYPASAKAASLRERLSAPKGE
jgi:DNA-directed RNA polymerase specialized sigma24 family protein